MEKEVGESLDAAPSAAVGHNIKSRLLKGLDVSPENDYLDSRKILLFNSDVNVGVAAPKKSVTTYFYKNADADELLFVHKGKGRLLSIFGEIPFEYGDYIIIPRGIIYQIQFETEDNRLLFAESHHPIYTPKRYRNWFGQHLEHSPYCERDFKLPQNLTTHDEKGDFLIKIKKQGKLHQRQPPLRRGGLGWLQLSLCLFNSRF
mgnify:CR=1 FL=1